MQVLADYLFQIDSKSAQNFYEFMTVFLCAKLLCPRFRRKFGHTFNTVTMKTQVTTLMKNGSVGPHIGIIVPKQSWRC